MKSDYVYPEEADELIAAMPYEYRAVVIAAAETGFRIGDLCKARACDYNPAEGTIQLREQKTGKIRISSVTPRLEHALLGTDGKGLERWAWKVYLFEHDGHKPISRATVWRWVTRTWARLHQGENRNITPHSLRKMYAVDRRQNGWSLQDIRIDLNHERIETTLIYAFADVLHQAEIDGTNGRYTPVDIFAAGYESASDISKESKA